jgi:starch-binding outer membrane protein, SusD/RagB family
MAENYCGAVPLSRETSPGVFEYGPALSTRQLLERAVVKADSALAVVGTGTAAAAVTQARVARIVKARALLNLNQPAAAATAIGGTAGVPSNFQYVYVHSELTGRQNNGTWGLVQNSGRFGVANVEGVNGLPFRSEGDVAGTVRDPRVANQRRPTNNGLGFDGATPMWWQLKYPVRAAPTVIADGVEARLIEAEAAYLAGNYLNALAILNALRSDAGVLTARGYGAALPALPPAVGATAQEDQIFKERAYWLFLTSHRLGDMRRLTRPTTAPATDISGYGRAIESVFPTGVYHKPGTYGTDVNSPIPQAEDNNPEFDRAACVVTKP